MVSLSQFSKMIPTNKEPAEWFDIAIPLFRKYEIDTVSRVAGFMSQCAYESGDFRMLEENLNYSWQRLRQVFPRYFKTDADAQRVNRNPEAIANIVYDDKNRVNKIGNTQPGDGWRFRGRGIIQLTGRWNYAKFGEYVGMTAEEAAEYLSTKKGALESACWYWSTNRINRFADANDVTGMTKAINGGSHGLSERAKRFNSAKSILSSEQLVTIPSPVAPVAEQQSLPTLQVGSRGALVRAVQAKLNITADGSFGPATKRAVENWQSINSFNKTGVLTPDQLGKLLQ